MSAERGGFGRAALQLDLPQSPVGRWVKQLELRLGFALFESGVSGVTLTRAGLSAEAGALSARPKCLGRDSALRWSFIVVAKSIQPMPASGFSPEAAGPKAMSGAVAIDA